MSTLTITSDSVNKLFGLRQKIENNLGISLAYRSGMILGSTTFYKQDTLWFTILNNGDVNFDGRVTGSIKNKCAPQDGRTVIATITSSQECAKAVLVTGEKRDEILFLKEGNRIATVRGSHHTIQIDFENSDDLWILLVLGWCSLQFVFMKAWDRITYFEPALDLPRVQDKTTERL
jgi:hypothetical protein